MEEHPQLELSDEDFAQHQGLRGVHGHIRIQCQHSNVVEHIDTTITPIDLVRDADSPDDHHAPRFHRQLYLAHRWRRDGGEQGGEQGGVPEQCSGLGGGEGGGEGRRAAAGLGDEQTFRLSIDSARSQTAR